MVAAIYFLLTRATGERVSMPAFRVFMFYLQGWTDEDELIAGLKRIYKKET